MAPSITRRFVLRMKFISSISRKMGIILSVVFKEAGAQHEWTTRKSENAAALNTELFFFFSFGRTFVYKGRRKRLEKKAQPHFAAAFRFSVYPLPFQSASVSRDESASKAAPARALQN